MLASIVPEYVLQFVVLSYAGFDSPRVCASILSVSYVGFDSPRVCA